MTNILDQDTKLRVVNNMKKYGGSFVKALADCILSADNQNLVKLMNAFPEYINEYMPANWMKRSIKND